jgi:hypothetical protein
LYAYAAVLVILVVFDHIAGSGLPAALNDVCGRFGALLEQQRTSLGQD